MYWEIKKTSGKSNGWLKKKLLNYDLETQQMAQHPRKSYLFCAMNTDHQ